MPRAKKKLKLDDEKFRVNRKKVGFTYSCPVKAEDNPIPSRERIIEFYEGKWGPALYLVCEELHKSGKRHYHGYFKFDEKIDVKNPKAFDIDGVHPQINDPGGGWHTYCVKAGEYITNIPQDIFHDLKKCTRWDEARELLLERKPDLYFKFGESIRRNFEAQLPGIQFPIFYGPYPFNFDWQSFDFSHQCLVLTGEPGTGKTVFARMIARTLERNICYIKGCLDKAKSFYKSGDTIIYDDIVPYAKWTVNDWCSMFDAESGGSVNLRNQPLNLDPGYRIFIHNGDIEWPKHGKIDRRIHIVDCDMINRPLIIKRWKEKMGK